MHKLLSKRTFLLVAAIALTIYVCAFLVLFQPLTSISLVTESGAFLGPPLRHNPDFEDIGKIYIYHGQQTALYYWFAPLCWLWGVFNMFTWWLFLL